MNFISDEIFLHKIIINFLWVEENRELSTNKFLKLNITIWEGRDRLYAKVFKEGVGKQKINYHLAFAR